MKVRVTFLSAMPPVLMATQEYWPRSLLLTEVTVKLKFLTIPPTTPVCQNMFRFFVANLLLCKIYVELVPSLTLGQKLDKPK